MKHFSENIGIEETETIDLMEAGPCILCQGKGTMKMVALPSMIKSIELCWKCDGTGFFDPQKYKDDIDKNKSSAGACKSCGVEITEVEE